MEERLRLRVAELEVLLAERDAALRRARTGLLEVGDVRIDLIERTASRGGSVIPLLPREFALLACLARRAGALVDRRTIELEVWGRTLMPQTNAVAVHVCRLRDRLGPGSTRIVTERGRGYRLDESGHD